MFFFVKDIILKKLKNQNYNLYPRKEKMIKISFNKITFSKPINESLMFLEVYNQNG